MKRKFMCIISALILVCYLPNLSTYAKNSDSISENEILSGLFKLYESDIKFNNPEDMAFGDAFKTDFEDFSSIDTVFTSKTNVTASESGLGNGGGCVALKAETNKAGVLGKKFKTALSDGVYRFSFDIKISDSKSCYTYVDFTVKNGSGYNTFVIMPEQTQNANLGFFHSKRLWSQSAYNTPIKPNEWTHIDMMLDLDMGTVTYYSNGEKLKLCRYNDLSKAQITGFAIRREIHNTDDGSPVYIDNAEMEKVYGSAAAEIEQKCIEIDNRLLPNEIRVGFVSDSAGNILFDDSSFGLVIYNRSSQTIGADIQVTVKDSGLNIVYDRTEKNTVGAKEKKVIPIDFKNLKYGLYNATALISENGKTVIAKTEFSHCVNAENTRCQNIGVNTHMSREADFSTQNGDVEKIGELMSKAGFGITREALGGQNFTVDSKGLYESFAEDTDREKVYEDASINRGIGTIQILCGDGTVPFKAYSPITDTEIENFAKYASDMVRKYKDKVKCWEIWNEYNLKEFNNSIVPNAAKEQKELAAKNYAKLLRAAYTAIKKEDSDSIVIGFAAAIGLSESSWKGIDFIEEVLNGDKEIINYFDVVSFHYYGRSNTCGETSGLVETLNSLHTILKTNNCGDKPVWLTETGFTTGNYTNATSSIGVGEVNQANYLIKTILLTDANDSADKVLLYTLADKGRKGVYENGFGMVKGTKTDDIPFSAKPSYLAMANRNKLFSDSTFLKLSYDESKRVIAYQYTQNDGSSIAALYDKDGEKSRSLIFLGCDNIKLIDLYGNKRTLNGENGFFEIPISDNVCYIAGNFSDISFCDNYTEGYKTVFEDNFDDYSGGNREFYRGISSVRVLKTENDERALWINDNIDNDSAVIRKIFLKDCIFKDGDKAKISFDLILPNNPNEYLSQTYIRLRNDSAAPSAVTGDDKKKTWLMFADIYDGHINTFKTGGAYLYGNYNNRIKIEKDKVYKFTLELDLQSKKYTLNITDGEDSTKSTVDGIDISAFDSIEIITVKSDTPYTVSMYLDNIKVQKYFELCRKPWEAEFSDKNNKPISFIDEIVGDEVIVHSKVNLPDILNKENLTVIAAMYIDDVLYDISSIKCTGDDTLIESVPAA